MNRSDNREVTMKEARSLINNPAKFILGVKFTIYIVAPHVFDLSKNFISLLLPRVKHT